MSKVIGVDIDGVVTWHAINPFTTDYETMCSLDADDPVLGHNGIVKPSKGQKINCDECKMMFESFKSLALKKTDFET